MEEEEGAFISQDEIEEAPLGSSQAKAKSQIPYVDEWVYFLHGSSNAQGANSHEIKDPYNFYRKQLYQTQMEVNFFGSSMIIG